MVITQRWRVHTLSGSTITAVSNGGPLAAVQSVGLTMQDVESIIMELPEVSA